jgi:cytochrome c
MDTVIFTSGLQLVRAAFAIVVLLGAFLSPLTTSAASAAPPDRGKLLFLRCASCHDISDKPSRKTGPNLAGVFGRRVASLPGYNYSAAIKAQAFDWDAKMLDKWLTKPSEVVPGTAMAFGGLPKKADRDAVIAYLRRPAK